MLRNRGLRSQGGYFGAAEDNPLDGLANLVDVILVFACGLMIAIITFWNVDLSKVRDIIDQSELRELENPERAIEDGDLSDTLENRGSVYEDPETGKMYVIMP